MTPRVTSVALVIFFLADPASPGEVAPGLSAVLDRAVAAAETSLREGEREVAESFYRSALLEGWLLEGSLEAAAGRLDAARDAFRQASSSAVETQRALQALAVVELRSGNKAEAVRLLTRVVAQAPRDSGARLLLADALVESGQPQQAVQELEEARAIAPDDLELTFVLATGYLRLKKPEVAERLFAKVLEGRPIPQTRVLIGRTYRDFGEYERARVELRAALKQDPTVRRAHYHLGMLAVLDEGVVRLEEAIGEFQAELKLEPRDLVTSLRLGMALVEAQRHAEALPHLELATSADPPPADAFLYLGRARLAMDQPQEAVAALERGLELAKSELRIGSGHYQLGLALRRLGRHDEAARHFSEAERYSTERALNARERLARYLSGGDGDGDAERKSAVSAALAASPLSALAPDERDRLRRYVTNTLARSYVNLGVMHAQAERPARAVDFLEQAARLVPDFPQVQYSLGVTRFNAQRFEAAIEPLSRALAESPENADLRHMLAMSYLNTSAYQNAVDLLQDDRARAASPPLQVAYGLALVRSGRAQEAQRVFSRLLAEHGDSAELGVFLGQAYAQQGDYESAVRSLLHALELQPGVAEASSSLGVIYLKQGRLAEAEAALRAELQAHPDDQRARQNLANVLELAGKPEEALSHLRTVLKAGPDSVDARYLLGKILLAQGNAADAVIHLEAAAQQAPEDSNVRYQLGQAYQKLGRPDEAQRQFDAFRALKDKRRSTTP
ncbi:MAG TPA: tetratricopeptide repeat protein [Vicinamibacteria bacterium]|nr:tetratricopeptide repeat protein [Vicinamibacteria bacterium]